MSWPFLLPPCTVCFSILSLEGRPDAPGQTSEKPSRSLAPSSHSFKVSLLLEECQSCFLSCATSALLSSFSSPSSPSRTVALVSYWLRHGVSALGDPKVNLLRIALVMPIAIIPRAWDFSLMPLAPPSSSSADSHHEQPMRDRSSALPNVMYPVEPRPFPFTDIRSGETPQTDPSYQVSSSPAAVTFAEPPDTSQDAEETSDKAAAAQQDQEEFALLPPPNQRSPGERPAIEPRSSSAMQNFMTPPETPAVDADPHTEGLTHKPSRTPSEHIPHWNRSSFLSTNSTSTNGSFKGSEVSYGMEEDSHSLPGQRDQLGSTPPLL